METKKHPFAETLGPGPYKFMGTYDMGEALAHQQSYGDTAAAFRNAPKLEAGLGTCAHCGRAILYICIVRRGDGKLYGVGSDCISKVTSSGDFSGLTEFEKELKAHKKAQRTARENKKREELGPKFEVALLTLSKFQHPNEFLASRGKTYADYFKFCPRNSENMKRAISMAESLPKNL